MASASIAARCPLMARIWFAMEAGFVLFGGQRSLHLPRFTGENPDSTTAVHDDFLICPFGTSLFDMMNCPRLAPRYRAVLRDAEQKGSIRGLCCCSCWRCP